MKMKVAFGVLALSLVSGYALADQAQPSIPGFTTMSGDDDDHHRCRPGDHDCEVKTRDACFNLVCYYDAHRDHHSSDADGDNDRDHKVRRCRAALTFTKDVTLAGGEVSDGAGRDHDRDHDRDRDRRDSNIATFDVSCDGVPPQNNSGHRYTDLLGTRIQAINGPVPAITLPRGALHTGPDHLSGYHVSTSTLEVDNGKEIQKLKGTCHIWTGAP